MSYEIALIYPTWRHPSFMKSRCLMFYEKNTENVFFLWAWLVYCTHFHTIMNIAIKGSVASYILI